LLLVGGGTSLAQTNLLPNGDLEDLRPNFWMPAPSVGGVRCEWATDRVHQGDRSFKVVKPVATPSAYGWMSVNNADLYWNDAKAGRLYTMGFWAKTEGVNTNPTGEDQLIGGIFEFWAGGQLLGRQVIAVDQTVASKDWTEYTAGLVIPEGPDPDSVVVLLGMERNATGTVWFDDVYCGSEPWSMGIFGGDAETPVGWMNWTSSTEIGYANVSTVYAHSGQHSVLLREQDDNADEMVFYSEPVPVKPNAWYKISVWARWDSVNTDEKFLPAGVTPVRDNDRLGLCFFFHRSPIRTEWNLTGGDQFLYFDQTADSAGWTYYSVIAKAPEDAAGLSVRARFTSFPVGYCWYDDFTIEEIQVDPNILVNGDLEDLRPNFWMPAPSVGGVRCEWATDRVHQGDRSFKVVKPVATPSAYGWMSVNNADLYWNDAKAGRLYTMGFWAKTEGVNTNPTGEDQLIGGIFEFWAGGQLLGRQVIAVDQTVASKDWTEYTAGLVIPEGPDPDSVVVLLGMERNATGTVWFDDVYCGSEPWSMGIFGGDAETPVGWMNWTSSTEIGYANVSTVYAHSGQHSVLLREQDDNADEMVFYSEPVPVKPNAWYKISVWARWDSVNTDPRFLPSYITPVRDNDRLGLCFFYHREPLYKAWDLTGGDQFVYFDQTADSAGWTYYTVISKSPEDAAGISVRARFTSFPVGYCWYDDFAVEPVTILVTGVEELTGPGGKPVPTEFGLKQNYPNPFNPSTTIEFTVDQPGVVRIDIFNLTGQKVRTLLEGYRTPGEYRVTWDGTDDLGRKLTSGVYLVRLSTVGKVATKKMVLTK
jgi:hypothetical protein